MNSSTDRSSWEFKWRIIVIYVILMVSILGLIVVTFLTDLFHTPKEGQVPSIVWLLLAGAFLLAIIATLSNIIKIFDAIQENSTKLEIMAETLKSIQSSLTEINQITHLSESAKAIILRDEDQQSLREAVLEKIKQQEYETADEIIEAIAHDTGYTELADELRAEMNKHHGGTEEERMNQAITAVEKLFDNHEWVKANSHIEKLIKANPNSEEAKALRIKLVEKKEERKKVLLNAWDDAVSRRATDRPCHRPASGSEGGGGVRRGALNRSRPPPPCPRPPPARAPAPAPPSRSRGSSPGSSGPTRKSRSGRR